MTAFRNMQIRNTGSSRNMAPANVPSCCDIPIQGQVFVVVLAGVLCYDSLFSEYPGLPGMKLKIGNPKHKPAAATEVSWWTGSAEMVPDLKGLVIFRKSSAKHRCSQSPVNIGVVFERQKGLQKVATWAGLELATFLRYKALSSSSILMYVQCSHPESPRIVPLKCTSVLLYVVYSRLVG